MNTLTRWIGHRWTFGLALLWCAFGRGTKYFDEVINIIGFLTLFVIQNTQGISEKALHLKLDEIIRAIGPADNSFRAIEEKTEEEIKKLKEKNEENLV